MLFKSSSCNNKIFSVRLDYRKEMRGNEVTKEGGNEWVWDDNEKVFGWRG